ncbi:MAG TPA: sulfatase-like hydrolase/transferase [Terriglobales bacterium]|nr:sulfatase-like hydrolase/transferase [Terriglobales bacterium]
MFGRFSTFPAALTPALWFSPLWFSRLRFTVVIALAAGCPAFAQQAPAKPVQTKPQAASGATRPGTTRSNATKPIAKPSVILITIDTLRADHVGCYGAQMEMVKTPTLDALARDGVVFERAISQVPLTWPSHAVILTGTYPFQNGVQDFTGQPLAQQFRTVSQAFQQAGYATGAVVSAFVLDRSWGLGRGFDFYDDAFSAETFAQKDIGLVDRRAGESVAHAIAWLKKTPRRPFFLWLHLYDPHSPYDPPEPYRSEYRSHLYDGEIAYADHELGNLMSWLKQNRLYDSSLILALSDHGESLGEHGEDEHGFFVYNATVHVPLIVKPPAGSGIAAGRRREPVETTAVAPTLLQLAGVKGASDSVDPIYAQFQSHALLSTSNTGLAPNAAGNPRALDPAYSETFYPFSSFGWSPLHGLESERFHFIESPQPELYDLDADPGETRNVVAQQPATVAVLREKMQALLAHNPFTRQDAGAGNLSPDAQEKLRALGYFGFRAAVSPEALKQGLADPKDKLWEFNSILKATDAFQRGEDDQAEALLNEVQQKDPQIYVIPFLLGESALRRQNWEFAAEQLQRCLVLNPNFDNAMTGLARALAKLGRADDARGWLQKALRSNPQNYRAWYQTGLLDAGGDPSAAQSAYEKAIAIQPNFSAGQRELGMIFFQQKSFAAAAPHLEKAIELGLEDARLHNFLGICYNRTNQTLKAVREFQRAIELDPKLADAHLNLAFAHQLLHHTNAAHQEYAAACQLDQTFCKFVPKN